MFFLGDYATTRYVDFSKLKELFGNDKCVVNLEGTLTEIDEDIICSRPIVFNTKDALRSLLEINTKIVTIANNHIFDMGNRIQYNKDILNKNGISAVGAGKNIDEANTPVCISENGQNYVIFSFCWSVTGGKTATKHKFGIAPTEKKNIESCVVKAKENNPDAKIIVIMHWGIELEKYPEPMHIELAHHVIDCGADLIIGHHPHCIQPIERYKGKYIFYSIGNFYIEENKYFDGRLDYPAYAHTSLAIRLSKEEIIVYYLTNENNQVKCTEILNASEAEQRFHLPMCEDNNYSNWFRHHRVKKKFIPIYDKLDAKFENACKDVILKIRGFFITTLVKLHLKNGRSTNG